LINLHIRTYIREREYHIVLQRNIKLAASKISNANYKRMESQIETSPQR